MTLVEYEEGLKKQQIEIENLRKNNSDTIALLEKAREEHRRSKANLARSYRETIQYYENEIAQYQSLRGTIPDKDILRKENDVLNNTEPKNKALKDFRSSRIKIVFPLSGFDGKIVRAKLVNLNTQESRVLEPVENPKEISLRGLDPDHFYRISFQEFHPENKTWTTFSERVVY